MTKATVVLIFQDVIIKDSDGDDQPALEISYQQFPIDCDPELKRQIEKTSPAIKAARRVVDMLSAHAGKRIDKAVINNARKENAAK